MLSNNYLSLVIATLEYLIINNEKIYSDLIPKIQTIPYDKLSEKIKETFINPNEIVNLKYDNIICKKASKFHPDLIINNQNFIEELKKNIKDVNCINFIRNLCITYFFHESIDDVRYGIIQKIRNYNNEVVVIDIKRNKIDEFRINFDDINKYQPENIVVIEDNKTIHLLNGINGNLDKIGYIKSEIIKLDLLKKEGFIRKTSDLLNKDYFFNFRSCNFVPEKGDLVNFISSINTSNKYLNVPLALRITKIEMEKCQIISVGFNKQKNLIFGEAEDIKTKERLFFRLSKIEVVIQNNDIYEYSIIHEAKDEFLKLIKLKLKCKIARL